MPYIRRRSIGWADHRCSDGQGCADTKMGRKMRRQVCDDRRRRFLRGLAGLSLAATASSLCSFAGAPQGKRRVDIHHHFLPPLFEQTAKARNRFIAAVEGLTIARSLEEMDRNGVQTAVLSMPSPGVWYNDVPLARRLARDNNDYAAGAISDHPGRFGMFATLPLPDVEGSLIELAYALDVQKADGVHMWTSYGDFWLGDARLRPLLEELNRRKAVVYTHPTTPACCGNLLPEAPTFLIEYGTDTSRAIASLIFSGATHTYPDIRWIFSHAGGTMPFLMERFLLQARLLSQTPGGTKNIPNGVMYELKRLRFETAQAANPYAMRPLTRFVPKTQIFFGTDFPYRDIADNVQGLADCNMFTARELQDVERFNAIRLFPKLA